jgi:arabinan endo-1,5-alpha-L-arabinosidase
MAQATSTDLRNWSTLGTQGYTNSSLYKATKFEGYYYVKNANSGLYLDVADGSSANGANIRQWTYNGAASQIFKIVSNGSGYYYIYTGASNYASVVDVTDGSSANGANIRQWAYLGGNAQLYKIVQNDDGTVTFLTKATGDTAAIEVYYAGTAAGDNVDQWTNMNGACQKWKLVKAGGTGSSSNTATNDSLFSALKGSFAWAGYNDQDSTGGSAVWAPDVVYNANYVWADGTKGAYMMYYCTSSTYIRSAIGYGVSKSVTGPFEYVDTIIYSGFTSASNVVTTTSSLGTKSVDIIYKNTNIPTLIDQGKLSGTRSGWWNSNGSYNNTLFPNAIDPTLTYDASGNLWMVYGSWSGGIYILQIDKATGQPIYPKTNSGNTDGYFGTRIAGGYTKSGEAPYIVYDSESGYFYLYVTYGWLGVDGGYHMRMYRSKTINGTYLDAAGNQAVFSSTTDQGTRGIKVMGNYNFSSLSVGYKSAGHNSAFVDTDGARYLVYHTRFNGGTEYHEARVHQQFLNADNWPVTAVYEYLGSSINKTGYLVSEMCGTYEFVNHGLDASNANVGMLSTKTVKLNMNGTITGDVTGTWTYTSGTYYATMVVGGVTYKGVFFKQKDESASHKEVMTFTLIGANNQTIWGSKTGAYTFDGDYYMKNVFSGLYLDVYNNSAANNTVINQWAYNGGTSQKFRLVSDGSGYYYIKTASSNYASAIDVASKSTADGAAIIQYAYSGGTNQKFEVVEVSQGKFALKTRITSSKSCIEIYNWSTVNGGKADQWNYWGGDCQLWNLTPIN